MGNKRKSRVFSRPKKCLPARKRTVLARDEPGLPTTEDGDLDVFVAASEDVANQSSVASDSCTGYSSDEVMSSDEL